MRLAFNMSVIDGQLTAFRAIGLIAESKQSSI
ncbi:hypothetical protein swp_2800 [Shewanella piezotolerans WP3]|uniref:Uncharacterized protein n=1 Tax=Shewanella piezotolerans (strain WP3 / JCM 13877) TaxID=225849 RepID=B8CPF0_SHEPW|nr:hypothetical protein swp_2800 [Shewanella piezotolerans WP3]